MKKRLLLVPSLLAAFAAANLFAQAPPPPAAGDNVVFFKQAAPPEGAVMATAVMEVIGGEGISGKVVTNAPYTAEATNETTRVLADGTRISHKNTTALARDSQGRTRRDSRMGGVGPWGGGTPAEMIFIHDPVAKEDTILHPQEKIARKIKLPETRPAGPASGPQADVFFERFVIGGPGAAGQGAGSAVITHDLVGGAPGHAEAMARTAVRSPKDAAETRTESLGEQTIDGIVAEGTRRTTTIPVNAIGNDRPIQVVSERWFSPELQVVVMSKTTDPQMGESTYKLSNVVRSEPPATLFQVPAGYEVKEGGPARMQMMRRSAQPNQ